MAAGGFSLALDVGSLAEDLETRSRLEGRRSTPLSYRRVVFSLF